MPFYEYQCQACGAQVEVLQKISDAPLKKCRECAKSKLVKLVSAPVFRLKGSGWYETDFKSDQDNKRNLVGEDKEATPAAKDAAADAKPAATDDKAADAKPEAKADAKAEPKPVAKPEAAPSKKSPARSAPSRSAAKPVARKAKPAAKGGKARGKR